MTTINPICAACGGACCKTIMLPIAEHLANPDRSDLPWLEARGEIVEDSLIIDSRCRHLDTCGLCRIYDTRPRSCVAFEVDGEACRRVRSVDAGGANGG